MWKDRWDDELFNTKYVTQLRALQLTPHYRVNGGHMPRDLFTVNSQGSGAGRVAPFVPNPVRLWLLFVLDWCHTCVHVCYTQKTGSTVISAITVRNISHTRLCSLRDQVN